MKKFTKTIVFMISLVIVFASIGSALAGCAKKEEYDNTKTQLFVGTFNGGYKTEWLSKAAKRFEAQYADYKIGDKVGIEVIIDSNRDFGNALFQSWGAATNEIFFTEGVDYYNFVGADYLLDITDVVTSKIPGENKSIFDKLNAQQQDYYAAAKDGTNHFYGVPFASGFAGIIYDVDLFFAKGLYYSKDYDVDQSTGDKFIRKTAKDGSGKYVTDVVSGEIIYHKTTAGDTLSKGPDGRYGTTDDGLPATYYDFFTLCDYMLSECNVKPFSWSGKARTSYLHWLLAQSATDYEGTEQMNLNFSFTGTAKNLVTANADGSLTPLGDKVINSSVNPLDMYKSAGKYHAYEFLKRIFSGDKRYCAQICFQDTADQFAAQRMYLNSKNEGMRSAFLVDGIWWQNEASDSFKYMESIKAEDSKANRQLALMSLPKVDNTRLGQSTLIDTHNTLGFVRKTIATQKVDIAKKFMQFCFTEESNKEFNLTTGVPRPLEYSLSESELAQLSYFERSVWDLSHGSKNSIVYPFSKNEFYIKNQTAITTTNMFHTRIDGTNYINVLEPLLEKNYSIKQLFDGIYDFASARLVM